MYISSVYDENDFPFSLPQENMNIFLLDINDMLIVEISVEKITEKSAKIEKSAGLS